MSFDLNELRKQRDRIREHLAWLEKEIARAEGQPEPKEAPPPAEETTAKAPVAPMASPTGVTAPAIATPAEDVRPETTPADHVPMEYSPNEFGTGSKLGCILAAVAIMGLIVFLLFGLPFLLPPTEFEQANAERVASLDTRIEAMQTQEQKGAVLDEIRGEISSQRDILQTYEDQEEGISKEAQNTRKTIRELEDLLNKARQKPVAIPATDADPE